MVLRVVGKVCILKTEAIMVCNIRDGLLCSGKRKCNMYIENTNQPSINHCTIQKSCSGWN